MHTQINLVHSVPCGGVVKAKTHCDILLLSKTDTQNILQHFPEGKHINSYLTFLLYTLLFTKSR